MVESATNLESLFGVMRSEIKFVMGNACAADVLVKKPINGTAAFQIHFRGHDSFDFALKLIARESGLRILGVQGVEKSGKTGIGIGSIELAQHFAGCFALPSGPATLTDCVANAETLLTDRAEQIARLFDAARR